jgi:hypothetical protein
MARGHGLILVAALAFAAPAHADVYPLYGAGSEPLRPGILATKAQLDSTPTALAVRSDGTVAFTAREAVFWVRAGRVLRVPVPAYYATDLAFAPDGDLLVTACPGDGEGQIAGVFKAAPARAAQLVARFGCPVGVDVEADGTMLVVDGRRVRRVGPDGVIRTAAGRFEDPIGVAALPGGAFAVLERGAEEEPNRIRLVTAEGRITTLLTRYVSALAALPDGALLVAEVGGALGRLALDGTLTPIADVARDQTGIPSSIPVRGDPFGPDSIFVSDVVPAPDGGVLMSTNAGVQYLPPEAPALLAIALRPEMRALAPSLTVRLRTTKAAQVRIGVWRGARRVAFVTTTVPGGDAAVPIPTSFTPGRLWVHVQAADHDGIADAGATVLFQVLPVAYARDFIRDRLDLMEIYGDAPHVEIDCRRMSSRRVDCPMRRGRRCTGIVSMELERNGGLDVFAFDGGPRCRARGPARRGPLER